MGEDIEFDMALQEAQMFFKRYLGNRMSNLQELGIQRKPEDAEIVVSARRSQKASEAGYGTIEQWSRDESAFGVENRAIRRWENPTFSCGPEVLDDPTLPGRLNRELNSTLNFFDTEWTLENFYKLVSVIEADLGLVLEQEGLRPIDFDTLHEPREVRMAIKNMDHVIALLRKTLFPSGQDAVAEPTPAAAETESALIAMG
jgi:hypothetical protein